jgi:cytochrome c biogenesis protein CcmG, thiol:disulfide interchange protein DsbE
MTTTRSGRDRTGRLIVIGLAVAAVVVAAVIAVGVSGGGSDGDSDTLETGAVRIDGDVLPPYDNQGPDQAVGLTAPIAYGQTFDGSVVRVGATDGPGVVVFVAHWCHVCQAEVPVLAEWLAAGRLPDGTSLKSVATATDRRQPNYPPSAWLESEGWDRPVLLDDASSTVGRAFGVTAYPFFVWIDADGRVAARAAGALPPEEVEGLLLSVAG